MEVMKEWVRNIFILILALTFVEMLMPAGNIQKYIRYVFSMVIMASILMPLAALLE
ncbi:MAG: stage III sporulation protein AF [Firmicutes bacterium]|nr:stage III sporulation protein AF [Bacillota bacterium]